MEEKCYCYKCDVDVIPKCVTETNNYTFRGKEFKVKEMILRCPKCNSELFTDDIVDKSTDIKDSYQNLFATYESRNDLVWELSACTADSLAYENEETQDSKAHGKYTKELLEYLGYNFYAEQVEGPGMPYSKQLSVIDAWKYINDKFKRIGKQTPVTSVTERDLVLFTF